MDSYAHLYVTEWSDGRVKVGMGVLPTMRFREQHHTNRAGAWLRRARVFDPVDRKSCYAAELQLKKRLAAMQAPDEGCAEWFTGIPFETAEACAAAVLAG